MEPEAIEDLANLEPYFTELKSWPAEFSISAAMWAMLSPRVRDALEADIVAAGYTLTSVRAVEYEDGKLTTVTVILEQEES